MAPPYKICFLGYKQLTALAQQVVPELPFDDCEIQIADCIPDTLPDVVNGMIAKGFEVFIAGSSNAATFSRHSQAHLQEIYVRDIDYLVAMTKARELGSRIAIAWHRLSRSLNLQLLVSISGIPVDLLSYEDSEELYDAIRDSDYEVIIGASQACGFAADHHRQSVLVYAGKDTIRQSFLRARHLAIELQKERRHKIISQSLVHNIPMGIIVTDEEGRITNINHLARDYLNLSISFSVGRLLSDIALNLSPEVFLSKGEQYLDSYKIINGIRFRCGQHRLIFRGQITGVLTTLRVDNTRHARKAVPGPTASAAKWRELVVLSEPMKQAVALGKKYAQSSLPLGLIGDVSAHRQIFSECIHTGGPRAQGPLIMVNLPQISPQDAGRHLLGCSDDYAPHTGLIELANNGTLVLKNVQDACPAVQDILLDVLAHNQITPTGGYQPVEVNVRFISIFDKPLARGKIRDDLLQRLCTLYIDLPELCQRKEDLPVLFQHALSNLYERELRIQHFPKAVDILKLYPWPGNTSELEAVAGRFSTALNDVVKITPYAVQNALIQAIGQDQLYEELTRLHPCLLEKNPDGSALRAAVQDIKYYLGSSNAAIAERLGVSRSSLWRILREAETP